LPYPHVGENILPLRLGTGEHIAWLTAAADSVQQLSTPSACRSEVFETEVSILTRLADLHMERGDTDSARDLLARSLERLEDLHGRHDGIRQLASFGDTFRVSGQLNKAVRIHEDAFKDIERILLTGLSMSWTALTKRERLFPLSVFFKRPEEIPNIQMKLFASLGQDYLALRQADRAVHWFSQLLSFARGKGDRAVEARALCSLGVAYTLLGQHPRAMYLFEQSMLIGRELGDKECEGSALFSGARALLALHDQAGAITRAKAALEVFEKMGSASARNVRGALEQWRSQAL
jgi:tetratricopeptide (TPR) repeat protein